MKTILTFINDFVNAFILWVAAAFMLTIVGLPVFFGIMIVSAKLIASILGSAIIFGIVIASLKLFITSKITNRAC